MEGGLLLLALVAFLHWVSAKGAFYLHSSLFTKFIVLWMVYIVVHGRLSEVTELYRTVYLCVTLLSAISLSYCLSAGLLTKEGIYRGLLIIAVIHIFCVFAQCMGFMEPENSLYPITGACDNPNVTAMYLVGVLPVLLSVTRMRAVARLLFFFLILLAIVILRCRTAYIGLAVEIVVMLFAYGKARRLVFSHRWVVVVIGVLVCAFSAVKLYNMKRDSADGRLLIWKVSAMMVAERPLGCGYGLFPKHYNLRQAEYFHEEHGTETERRNASFVYMAYDDFLEHGVDGGVIGMLLLIGFYALLIRYAYRQRDTAATSVLTAFAVMSLVNFVIAGIQTWLLVVCTAAMVLGNENRIENKIEDGNWTGRLLHKVQGMLFLVFTMLLSIVVYRMASAQYRLRAVEHRLSTGETVSDSVFADIVNDIYSSEAFWRIRAENAMNGGKTQQSCTYAKEALQYTSVPELFLLCSRGCQQSGKTDDAVCSLTTVSQMQPSRLYPKLYLMRLYASTGRDDEALEAAADIMRTEIKVRSREARLIRREAYEYIKSKQQ